MRAVASRAGLRDGAGDPTEQTWRDGGWRYWGIAGMLVICANLLFLGLNVAGAALPSERLGERVRSAFDRGVLLHEDWRPYDAARGFNQYNECMILIMGFSRDADLLSRAVGPLVTNQNGVCATLDGMVRGSPPQTGVWPYTRYWHGYVPLATLLLQALELDRVRWLLRVTVVSTLLLLGIAARRANRGLFRVACSVATTGLLFWGLPYYGQNLSHAPGDAMVMLGLAGLLFWRERLARIELLVPYCAVFGAAVVYLEFFTGQLPIAAGLLFTLTYLVSVSRASGERHPWRSWKLAAAGLTAFVAGAVLTLVLKQLLAVVFVSAGAPANLGNQLQYYAALDDRVLTWRDRLFEPFSALYRRGRVLTYGSGTAARWLYLTTALAWCSAAWLALAKPANARARSDLLAFAVGASAIVAWALLLPTHTAIHSWMARMLIVPISLGWGALLWQLSSPREPAER